MRVRFGRCAQLRPGAEGEYDRLHAAVWPEVRAALSRAGIRNYSIFRHGLRLFSYFELPDGAPLETVTGILLADSACVRWEALIKPLQEAGADVAGNERWEPMDEVFHHA